MTACDGVLEGSVFLPKHDNAHVIQEQDIQIAQGDTTTSAQEHAFEITNCGATKTAQIAGANFNHKDDKKGQQDTFK